MSSVCKVGTKGAAPHEGSSSRLSAIGDWLFNWFATDHWKLTPAHDRLDP